MARRAGSVTGMSASSSLEAPVSCRTTSLKLEELAWTTVSRCCCCCSLCEIEIESCGAGAGAGLLAAAAGETGGE